MNTYKITAYLKITIEVDAPDDDTAWEDALAAQLADWTQDGRELEIVDCENLGVIQNDA
jgi:hypothetical protein